jgi:CHAD domain-containing protein
MATTATEIERKYETPPGFSLPDLSGLPGVGSTGRGADPRLDATYYDTEDLRLAANRITLRRRSGGDDEGWHLKRPSGADRTETREPLSDDLPASLAAEVRPVTGGEPLVPVARIRNHRRETAIRDPHGRVLAVVARDKVRGDRHVRPRGTARWRELEVELVDGERPLLDAVEAVLRSAGARPSDSPSKLARALSAPAPNDSGAAYLTAYLRAQRCAVVDNDPRVRAQDVDGLHNMRVAVRRLRATLRTFRPLLDRERTEPIRAELHWLAGLLGAVRDGDVLRDLVDGLPPDRVGGPVRARVRTRLDVDQAQARAALATALESQRYAALRRDLEALTEGEQPHATPKRLRRCARKALHRADDRLDRAVDSTDAGRDAALHDARRAYKRARYAVELVEPLVGPRAGKLAKRLAHLQDVLGDHQDAVVAAGLLAEFGIDTPLPDITDDLGRARRRAGEIRI